MEIHTTILYPSLFKLFTSKNINKNLKINNIQIQTKKEKKFKKKIHLNQIFNSLINSIIFFIIFFGFIL
jgi:hypothetical protein